MSEYISLREAFKWIANIKTPTTHDYVLWERKNRWLRRAGLQISEKVAIDRGFRCLTGMERFININSYTAIGVGASFWSFNSIKIGKFCMFAADVSLANGGHDTSTFEPSSGPLIIGNGCWIGNGARIVGPVTIGDNSIVAAGAVVVGDVPPGSIVAGVPAKIIKTRSIPDRVWHLGGEYFCPKTFEMVK